MRHSPVSLHPMCKSTLVCPLLAVKEPVGTSSPGPECARLPLDPPSLASQERGGDPIPSRLTWHLLLRLGSFGEHTQKRKLTAVCDTSF